MLRTINLYWGYLIGEEHLTDEQFAKIDFGNPSIDTEFITFDPLASSFFQGKYYFMRERKFAFPHRNLPSMRYETIIIYDETQIKIMDPPVDLNTPVGIFICIFIGEDYQIKKAKEFLGKRINLRFSPCDFDLELFYKKLSRTRVKIKPKSLVVSELAIDDKLNGNLEVIIQDEVSFLQNLKTYKPKNKQIKITIKEVQYEIDLIINLNGIIELDRNIDNLSVLDTIIDTAVRSVYTGSL